MSGYAQCPACGYWAFDGTECMDCGYRAEASWTLALALLLLLAVPASAGRTSRTQSGTAPCPDKAWRVLVIGGEIQPNSWCGGPVSDPAKGKVKGNNGRRLGWDEHQAKAKSEREAYDKKKADEKAARKSEDDKRRLDEAKRKADEAKRKSEAEKKKAKEDADEKAKEDAAKKVRSDGEAKDRKGCSK